MQASGPAQPRSKPAASDSASEPSRVDPERHLTIDGRAWRRSDPSIPAAFRQELVNELMRARRAVKAALSLGAERELAERAARARVQDAKMALGERGAVWWEAATDAQFQARAACTIRALLRHRAGKTICPSDVARAIGGAAWRARMALVRSVAARMAAEGQLAVLQKGKVVVAEMARGPIRLGFLPGTSST